MSPIKEKILEHDKKGDIYYERGTSITVDEHKFFTFIKKVLRHELRRNGFHRVSYAPFLSKELTSNIYTEDEINNYYSSINIGEEEKLLGGDTALFAIQNYVENELSEKLQPVYQYSISQKISTDHPEGIGYMLSGQVLGETDPVIDVQMISLIVKALKKMGLSENFQLEINPVGIEKEKVKFKEELENFIVNKKHIFSDEENKLIQENIYNVFALEGEDVELLLQNIIPMRKFLKKDSKKFLASFEKYLDLLEIDYKENPTIFPKYKHRNGVYWRIINPENGRIFAYGDRYDDLAKNLPDIKELPGSGFYLDMQNVVAELIDNKIELKNKDKIQVYFVQLGDQAKEVVFPLSQKLRASGINTQVSLGTPSIKEQMIKAQRSGAQYVIIVGVMEARSGNFQVRDIGAGTQEQVHKDELIEYLSNLLGTDNLNFYNPADDFIMGK